MTPTLYEWAGAQEALERLTEAFYQRVRRDDLLFRDLFADMPPDHPRHVATWFAEVFGGPARYTEEHGGYPHMLAKHAGLSIREEQRARWVQLISLAADDASLPDGRGVPLGVHGLRRVGHQTRASELPARRRATAQGAGPPVGLGEAPPYFG